MTTDATDAQQAIGKVEDDLKSDWADLVTWFSAANAGVQAKFHQALSDGEAAGSAIAAEIKGMLPSLPAPTK